MPFVRKRKLQNMRLAHRELRKEARKLRVEVAIGVVCRAHLTGLVNITNNVHATDPEQEKLLRKTRREAREMLIALSIGQLR